MNDIQKLIDRAIQVSRNAYIPYSNYPVGAAIQADDGTIFTGCNVENSSYPAGICAERAALVKAVSEGKQAFNTIVVATKNAGSPCGICRQMLFEFAPLLRVITVNMDGEVKHDIVLSELLKFGFGPQDLPGQSNG